MNSIVRAVALLIHLIKMFDTVIVEKSVGGTLFFSILILRKKRVWGYTVFLHLNEGRKECGVHCFSPS